MNAVNHAAQIASGVGAGTAVPSLGVGAVLQTIVGLAGRDRSRVRLRVACAPLRLAAGTARRLVKTIGGASLGGKERVAVVEIGDTWLVLGAAPGNVRLLHTMPAGSAERKLGRHATPAHHRGRPLQGTFGQRFRDALEGEAGKRLQQCAGGSK